MRKEATVVKNNRTNENDLREGLAEKARLTKEKVAREELEEKEREDRKVWATKTRDRRDCANLHGATLGPHSSLLR